jgi:hypothetical protein
MKIIIKKLERIILKSKYLIYIIIIEISLSISLSKLIFIWFSIIIYLNINSRKYFK